MLLSEIIAFNAFAWICSFTPGPNVTMAAATGVRYGVRAVVPQMIGVALGFVSMLWLAGVGGVALFQQCPQIAIALKISGIGYLLYLAWKLCQTTSLSSTQGLRPLNIPQAALFQIVNPKAWMMLVAATTTYALGHADFVVRLSWMSVGFILPSALSILCWAWMGDRLRSWLAAGRRYLIFNRIMGLSLALTAVWMISQ